MTRFLDPAVAAIFKAYPPAVKAKLLALRALIFDVAASTDGVGRLDETLKWGQPAYLTPETRSGTTIRLDAVKGVDGRCALYVHCQSDLMERFRALYGDVLKLEGHRAIVFDADDDIPREAVGHCIAMALTYHRDKRDRDKKLRAKAKVTT